MKADTIDPPVHLAVRGFGIALLPTFVVAGQVERGDLVPFFDAYVRRTGGFTTLWPINRNLSQKIRAFVNFVGDHVHVTNGGSAWNR